jgi:glycosyl transferase family 25
MGKGLSSMKIRVINLDKDVDRLDWMTGQLTGFGLNYERFSAIDTNTMSADQRRYASNPRRRGLRKGEIGCLLSHISVWQLVAIGNDSFGLVLEDDLHFAPDFSGFLLNLCLDSSEICIHRVETFLPRVTLRRKASYRCGKRSAFELYTNHGGAGAYIINKPTARFLLERIEAFSLAVDVELFDPDRRSYRDLMVYQWLPAPCIQDMHVDKSKRLMLPSNNVERQDIDSGVIRERKSDFLKDAFRSIYTAIYDVALFPFGKMRRLACFG